MSSQTPGGTLEAIKSSNCLPSYGAKFTPSFNSTARNPFCAHRKAGYGANAEIGKRRHITSHEMRYTKN